MHVHGSCYCGQITFRAEVAPENVTVCHCVDCHKLTGSAYRVSLPAPAETFQLLSGQPTTFLKIAESGNKRAHSFCGHCGSPVYATAAEGAPTVYVLRVGTLDERAKLPPKKEIWCRSALPWSRRLETTTQSEKQ